MLRVYDPDVMHFTSSALMFMHAGGQWRPSDGGSPSAPDAQALVNTAVRSVKEATGVDLSSYTDQVRRAAGGPTKPLGDQSRWHTRAKQLLLYLPHHKVEKR
jgi:hypothetical protein